MTVCLVNYFYHWCNCVLCFCHLLVRPRVVCQCSVCCFLMSSFSSSAILLEGWRWAEHYAICLSSVSLAAVLMSKPVQSTMSSVHLLLCLPLDLARTTSIILQNLVEIERLTEAWEYTTECDVFTNAPQITVAGDFVALFQQETALLFVGRFRCGLQRFLGKKSPFSEGNRFENRR